MAHAHLALRELTKSYRAGEQALAPFSLDIERGEFVTLLGPSGCGKTTTLRIIAGLLAPSSGTVEVDGVDITLRPPHRRNMGMVFQSYALFTHMTVAGNVGFGLEMRGLDRRQTAERVMHALAAVRLESFGGRRPRELSGGQQQRVALARALVIEPSVMLLDEPLSNLDAKLREELRQEIRELQRRLGITTVFVTLDQVEALALSDRIVVMSGGKIEQIGTPEAIYRSPATPFVASFIGRMNRLEGIVAAIAEEDTMVACMGGRLRVPGSFPVGARVVLMIRPHRLRLAQATDMPGGSVNRMTGRLRSRTYVGDRVHHEVSLADGTLITLESDPDGGQPSSEEVIVEWDVADGIAFPS